MGSDPELYVAELTTARFCPDAVQQSVFFDDMEFQIIEVDVIYKAVRAKAGLCVALELLDIGVQPDGPAQVKGMADLIQRMKYFMRPGIFGVV